MYDEPIISLCYVENVEEKTYRLGRIADYENGRFVPYCFDQIQFFGTERDILIGLTGIPRPLSGSISVFEWTVYQNEEGDWRTRVRSSGVEWIEVILSSCPTPMDIVDMIRNGWKPSHLYDVKHDVIICCKETNHSPMSVYIPASAFVKVDDLLFFSDNTVALDVGTIAARFDSEFCVCRFSKDDSRRYLKNLESWHTTDRIFVRSETEIAEFAVREYIKKLDKIGLIFRKERQAALSALSKLEECPVWENVAQQLDCSQEKAQKLVVDCISSLKMRLSTDQTTNMIEALITNDSAYVQTLRIKVEEEWEATHTTHLAQANAELAVKKKEYEALELKLAQITEDLHACEEKKLHAEEKVSEALQLQIDVEKAIQEQLKAIQDDKAKALVTLAWTAQDPRVFQPQVQPSARAFRGFNLFAPMVSEPVPDSELSDRMMDASDVWGALCGDASRAMELAAFFFATYAQNQSLLIVGECAEMIADLCSYLVLGTSCTKVVFTENADLDLEQLFDKLETAPRDYICILNGLGVGYNYIHLLMRRFPQSRFIITTPHVESLSMEPPSLFTTFLPVLSDEFCANRFVDEPERFSCKHILTHADYSSVSSRDLKPILANQRKWFSSSFFSPLLKDSCARLQFAITALCAKCNDVPDADDVGKRAMYALVLIPLMKCLHCKDIIIDILSAADQPFDAERKAHVLQFSEVEMENKL